MKTRRKSSTVPRVARILLNGCGLISGGVALVCSLSPNIEAGHRLILFMCAMLMLVMFYPDSPRHE